MNKAIHKLPFLLWLTATFLTACSQDDAPVTQDNHPDTPQITVTRSTGQGNGELATVFKNGTEVGLSVQGTPGYTNMKYEYRDGTLQPKGEKIFWESGKTSLTVDAYYPYRSDGNYTNPTVLSDQSTEANYYLSDALHATGTVSKSSNSMSLDFKHRTANITFNTTEDVDEVSILNQALTQGGAANNTIKAYRETARKWKACIIPTDAEVILDVNIMRNSLLFKAEIHKQLYVAGNLYRWKIKVPQDLSQGSIPINGDGTYTIIQSGETTGNTITINGSPTVTIVNLNISSGESPLHIVGGAPTIILKGDNKLRCTGSRNAGLQLGNFNTQGGAFSVTIQGDGSDNCSLTAEGNEDGAGIGTASTGVCGNITIKNCTVTAFTNASRYQGGAGIGAGGNSTCGNITIENAVVTATGSNKSAGIGTASAEEKNNECGDITIINSTVTAKGGGDGAAGIGTGGSNRQTFPQCGNITIVNSTITATGTNYYEDAGAAIGCGASKKVTAVPPVCGNISITLKSGQTKEQFLNGLYAGNNKAEKVGRSWYNGALFGTVGAITWYDFTGKPIQ